MIIYKITNKENGKIYIGCTSLNISIRWKRHVARRRDNSHLARAICSFGVDNFIIEEIEQLETSKEMFLREIFWINFYNSNDFNIGYNMTLGGDSGPIKYGKDHGMFGRKNKKLSDLNKSRAGIKLSKEHIANVVKAMTGKKRSEESKLKMSISKRKSWENGDYNNTFKRKQTTGQIGY